LHRVHFMRAFIFLTK